MNEYVLQKLKAIKDNLNKKDKYETIKKDLSPYKDISIDSYLKLVHIYKEEPELLKAPNIERPKKPNEPTLSKKCEFTTSDRIFSLLCVACIVAFICLINNYTRTHMLTILHMIFGGGSIIGCVQLILDFNKIKKNKEIDKENNERLAKYQEELDEYNKKMAEFEKVQKEYIDNKEKIKAENARRLQAYQEEKERLKKENYNKYLSFQNQMKDKYNTNAENLQKVNSLIDEVSKEIGLTSKYFPYVDKLIEYIEDGRADNVKEALNLLHNDWANDEVLKEEQRKNDMLEAQIQEQNRREWIREKEERQRYEEERKREYDRQQEIERHNREMEKYAKKSSGR